MDVPPRKDKNLQLQDFYIMPVKFAISSMCGYRLR